MRTPGAARRTVALAAVLSPLMVISLSACGQNSTGGSNAAPGGKGSAVGISMPTKSSERWILDGNNMVDQFKKLGYKPELQYGDNVVENQVSQIENMITKGDKLLVIAPIDGTALSDVLQKAADAHIPVISYDRLLLGTPNVDYYATFDNFKVGVLQGSYIIDKLGLKDGKGPFNIELFAGAPDDNNTHYFFNGAMSVLEPYIKSGKLVVRSGQTKLDQVTTIDQGSGFFTGVVFLQDFVPYKKVEG